MIRHFPAFLPVTALAFGIAPPCGAQHPDREVTGVVTDTAGKPIPNATVLVVGTSIQGITDALGRYRLCDLPAPIATLKAAFINYRALVKDSVALSDTVAIVDFRLTYSPITLNAIYLTPGAVTTHGEYPPLHLDSTAAAAKAAPVPPPTCHQH